MVCRFNICELLYLLLSILMALQWTKTRVPLDTRKKIIKLYIDGDKIDQYSDEYRFGVHSDEQIILLMDILKTIVIIHGY